MAKSETGSASVEPAKSAAATEARFHSINGIEWPVVRTVYDARQNIVWDYVEITKKVNMRDGQHEVKIQRRQTAPEEIQQKFRRGGSVEVNING
jgi:hypothetical protein